MVLIWNDTYEDLTPESFEKVLDGFAKGTPVKPGPQNGRQFSAPEGELTSLTDKALYGKDRTFKRIEMPPPAPPPQAPAAAAPPSNAGKPQTAAPETAPAVKSPSPVKTAEAPVALAKVETKAEASAIPEKVPERVAAAKKAASAPTAVAQKTPAEKSDGKPELLKKPKSGRGDDLKHIRGIGPKLEKMLNAMGVWHFDQIASWTKAEIKWVDERLESFKGRPERDEWVKQAKKVAKGWRPGNDAGEKPRK
jgi:NADH-quinone oxidoreductase subunit E